MVLRGDRDRLRQRDVIRRERALEAREIDVAVRGIIEAQFQRARALLATNRALLDEAARVLLAKETLAGEELEGILGRVGKESGPRIAATA